MARPAPAPTPVAPPPVEDGGGKRQSWIGMLLAGVFMAICIGALVAAIVHVRANSEAAEDAPAATAKPVPVPGFEEGME